MNGLAIIFDRLGPYHLARLKASANLGPITAVEIVARDDTYAWDPVHVGEAFRRVTLFENRPAPWALKKAMYSVLDASQPAAVAICGWSGVASWAALSWCLSRRVPAILMADSQEMDARRYFWIEWPKRRLVARFSSVLVGGGRHRAYLEKLGMNPRRIVHGYNVIDNDYFSRWAEQARLNPSRRTELNLPERYFLAVNRFVPKKNLSGLLAAFAQYRRKARYPSHKLVLLGDGPLRGELIAECRKLGLTDQVLMPGFKQYDELPAYYAFADLFVHASRVEQWGLVVNEAMACGLPVVVSRRCGCVPELVREGVNGYSFDPDYPDQLAELLAALADDVERRTLMGKASSTVIADWSPRKFAEALWRAAGIAGITRPAAN